MPLRALPECGTVSSHDDFVVWVGYLILSQIGQEEKFSDAKGDLIWPEEF